MSHKKFLEKKIIQNNIIFRKKKSYNRTSNVWNLTYNYKSILIIIIIIGEKGGNCFVGKSICLLCSFVAQCKINPWSTKKRKYIIFQFPKVLKLKTEKVMTICFNVITNNNTLTLIIIY